jgi:hypothetical protein
MDNPNPYRVVRKGDGWGINDGGPDWHPRRAVAEKWAAAANIEHRGAMARRAARLATNA